MANHVKDNSRTVNNHKVAVGKFQLPMPIVVYNRVLVALLRTDEQLSVNCN